MTESKRTTDGEIPEMGSPEFFKEWAKQSAAVIDEIDSFRSFGESVRPFATWFFALSSGSFLGLLLNLNMFVIDGRLAFKWLYLIACLIFSLCSFASAMFLATLYTRSVGFALAKDVVLAAPGKIERRMKKEASEEKVRWYKEESEGAIRGAVASHNLLPKAFPLFKGALQLYKIGIAVMAFYVALFVAIRV